MKRRILLGVVVLALMALACRRIFGAYRLFFLSVRIKAVHTRFDSLTDPH